MNILLDLYALNAGDEAQEQVHNGGGMHVPQQAVGEARPGVEVGDDLDAGHLIAIPVLHRNKQRHSQYSGTTFMAHYVRPGSRGVYFTFNTRTILSRIPTTLSQSI